jgi:tyrosine-protein phosphatase OCA6
MSASEEKKEEIITLDPLIPPYRFCMVDNGIYRGAYPTLPNFRFLSRLQLRTIISLTPEKPTEDLKLFCEMASIQIIHFPIERIANLNTETQSILNQALEVNFFHFRPLTL